MNPRCPVCGLKFEREQGYFLGAMYISYALMLPLLTVFLGLLWAFTTWDWWLRFAVAVALLVPLAPLLATISRVLWIHFDRAIDPEK